MFSSFMLSLSKRALAGYLMMAVSGVSVAQTMGHSPLGSFVKPGESAHLSQAIRAQLPDRAIAELDAMTSMAPGGEEVVVYSLTKQHMNPHVAVFKDSRKVNDFCVEELVNGKPPSENYDGDDDDDDDTGVWLNYHTHLEVPSPTSHAAIFAFNNYGDGSVTVLLAIVSSGGRYKIVFLNQGDQSQLRYFSDSNSAELWDAVPGSGGCVWCPENYVVTKLRWSNDKLVRGSRFTTAHTYSPYPMSDRPIVLLKQKHAYKAIDRVARGPRK
jgi:hypothetical protein